MSTEQGGAAPGVGERARSLYERELVLVYSRRDRAFGWLLLTFETVSGQGTTFRVRLPIAGRLVPAEAA